MSLLERMETLVMVAECGSYTEAAKRLFCSQPTISHHIQQLEQHFQATLLIRSNQQIKLTEQGRIVIEQARLLKELVLETERKIQLSLTKQQSMLSVYVSNYIASYYFTDILKHFRLAFPNQMLQIYAYCYDGLRKALQENKSNVALLPIYLDDEQLLSTYNLYPLFEEELELVVPADHPWLERKVLYARDLHDQTVLVPESTFISSLITKHLEERNIRVNYLQMSNFSVIKQSIKAGIGVAFLPSEVFRQEQELGLLAPVRISSLSIRRTNGFLVRKNYELTDSERAFCDEVTSFFSNRFVTQNEQHQALL